MKNRFIQAVLFALSLPIAYGLARQFIAAIPIIKMGASTPSILLKTLEYSGYLQTFAACLFALLMLLGASKLLSPKDLSWLRIALFSFLLLVPCLLLMSPLLSRSFLIAATSGALNGFTMNGLDFFWSMTTNFHTLLTYPLSFLLWFATSFLMVRRKGDQPNNSSKAKPLRGSP